MSTVEYVDSTKRRPPLVAADGQSEAQRISESSNGYGRSMLITGSVSVIYISQRVRSREQNIIYLYASVNLKPKKLITKTTNALDVFYC